MADVLSKHSFRWIQPFSLISPIPRDEAAGYSSVIGTQRKSHLEPSIKTIKSPRTFVLQGQTDVRRDNLLKALAIIGRGLSLADYQQLFMSLKNSCLG